MKSSYIVTGLPACGKSTVASKLSNRHGLPVVTADNFRYVDDKWNKAPLDVFLARIQSEVKAAPDGFVYDSAYNDAHDPEQARIAAIRMLIETAPAGSKPTVVRVRSHNVIEGIKPVVERSMGRAAGTIPQGACPETLDSVARLLVKFVKCFDDNEEALNKLEVWAKEQGCVVMSMSLDEVCASL